MEIEDAGELKTFEAQPKEGFVYLTVVRYSGNYWCGGPSSMDKGEVMRMLANWSGITAARVYAVRVPLDAAPVA